MFCSWCGKLTSDTDAFCGNCGRALARQTEAPSSVPSTDRGDGELAAAPEVVGSAPLRDSEGDAPLVVGRSIQLGSEEYELAGFGARLAGHLIDNVIFLVAIFVAGGLDVAINGEEEFTWSTAVIYLSVPVSIFAALWTFNSKGWSPGKRTMGLRTLDGSGGAPGAGRGLGRTLGAGLGAAPLFLGHLWSIWDGRKQTWHDKMAGTHVVRAAPNTGADPALRSASTRAKWVYAALTFYVLSSALLIWMTLIDINLLERIEAGGFVAPTDVADSRDRVVRAETLNFAALALSVVTFCFWIFRAYGNLAATHTGELRFSPGWAVGWFFVPIMSLFRPYQVMNELHQKSNPVRSGSPEVGWWWALWIAAALIGPRISDVFFEVPDSQAISYGWRGIVSGTLLSVAAILLIRIVRRITKWQDEYSPRPNADISDHESELAVAAPVQSVDSATRPSISAEPASHRDLVERDASDRDQYAGTGTSASGRRWQVGALVVGVPVLAGLIIALLLFAGDGQTEAEEHFSRGVELAEVGSFDKAIAAYGLAIEFDPEFALAFSMRGAAHSGLGERQQAIADYDRAITIDPDLSEAYYRRADEYGLLGDYERAITDFSYVIDRDVENALAHAGRASMHAMLGSDSEALSDWITALSSVEDPALRREIQRSIDVARSGEVLEYSVAGRVPASTTTAQVGFRLNAESAIARTSTFFLHEVSYREGADEVQRVPNADFEAALAGWGFMTPGTVALVATDDGTGEVLSVTVDHYRRATINSPIFRVTPSARYTLVFEARVTPNSSGGYFAIFFHGEGGEGWRERVPIEPPPLRYSASPDCDSLRLCLTGPQADGGDDDAGR